MPRSTSPRSAPLTAEIVDCRACPRLVEWREQVAREKRASFRDETYWGRPAPGFGDPHARVLVAGLAPAAHGANRTGRVFTGDRSGRLAVRGHAPRRVRQSAHLHRHRRRPASSHDAYVAAAVRCAPPANKPTPDERDRCLPYLVRELALLTEVRVIVVLGDFAYDAVARVLAAGGAPLPTPRPKFGHGVEVVTDRAVVLGCYHPSQQNTFTGPAHRAHARRRLSPGPRSWPTQYPRGRTWRGSRLLEGVYVALITPFAADGRVALDAVEQLCRDYLAAGCAGIVALGTTGESSALDADEQQAVIDACARVCDERDASADRRRRDQQHREDDRRGRSASPARRRSPPRSSSCRTTCGRRRPASSPTIRAVADASPVPIVIYNIPIRTGRNLGPAGMLELADAPEHRRGEAGGRRARRRDARDPRRCARATSRCSAATTPSCCPTMFMGGAGTISAAAHLCTDRFVAMIECGLAGKVDDGRAHAEALLAAGPGLLRRAEPRGVQGRAARPGPHPDADVRLPLLAASDVSVQSALATFAAAR